MIDYMVNRFCIVEWSFQNLIAAIENDNYTATLGFPIKMDIVAIVSLLLVNIVHLPRFPCT